MKILNTRDLRKEAGLRETRDWLVDKGSGFIDKIRNVFQESDNVNQENYAEDMIGEVQDEDFEKNTVNEIGKSQEYVWVEDPSSMTNLTTAQRTVLDAIETEEIIKIGYETKDYNTYIVRNIKPLYTYKAITTSNDIVVSHSVEAQDYRAFIINNIISAQ